MKSLNYLYLSLLRNAPNLSIKYLKYEKCFLAKKTRTSIFFVSLTLIPPITVYAKKIEPIKIDLQQQINDKADNEDDEIGITQQEQTAFTWRELWELIKPNYFYFVISILSSFVVAYLNIKIPLYLGELINELSKYVKEEFNSNEFFSSIKSPAIHLIWSYVLQGCFTSIAIASLTYSGENIAVSLRTRLFQSIIQQDLEFYDRRRVGEIMSVLNSDVQEFKSSFKTFFSQGLRSSTQTLGSAISLYIISPKMTAFLCVLVPNVVLVGSLIGSLLREISNECQQQTAKCSAITNEIFSSIQTIKSSAMEEREIELYKEEIEKLNRLNQSLGAGISCFQGASNIALNGVVLSTLLFGGYLMGKNEIKPGDLMSFLVASQTIQRSLASLSLMTGHYVKYTVTANRIFDYIRMEPKLKSNSTARLDPLIGEISFRKVTFAYPTRKSHKVFDQFSFKINPGTKFAIVGYSGSGKSTISKLLLYFYDVDSGCINIDGINIKNLDLKWLRSEKIGYINQEPILFATSIMENIRYGSPKSSDEDVRKAAKLANAFEFIEKLPNKFETNCGERGVQLSGGQKQRIVIARELLKNPQILVLDEATSSLDTASEKLITDAIDNLKGKTIIIIAHRLSTIKNADLIAVLSNGKIQELGNHDELVSLKGLYWQLIKQQQIN